MKPSVAAILTLLAIPGALAAQAKAPETAAKPAPAHQMGGGEVPGWMRSLDMTADQRAAIARIHHDAHAKMDAAKKQWAAAGKSADKDPALKAEMQRMMDAEHSAFREALSPATRPAYDAALKAHLGAEHGGMGAAKSDGMKHEGMKHDGMKHDGMKHDATKQGAGKPPAARR